MFETATIMRDPTNHGGELVGSVGRDALCVACAWGAEVARASAPIVRCAICLQSWHVTCADFTEDCMRMRSNAGSSNGMPDEWKPLLRRCRDTLPQQFGTDVMCVVCIRTFLGRDEPSET